MKTLLKKITNYPYAFRVIGKVELSSPSSLNDVEEVCAINGDFSSGLVVISDNVWCGKGKAFDLIHDTNDMIQEMGVVCGFNRDQDGLKLARKTISDSGVTNAKDLLTNLYDGYSWGLLERKSADADAEMDAKAEAEFAATYDPQR